MKAVVLLLGLVLIAGGAVTYDGPTDNHEPAQHAHSHSHHDHYQPPPLLEMLPPIGPIGIMAIGAVATELERRTGENRFDHEIQQAAAAYDLAPELVKAVVWRESGFNPDARGSSGEYGLMQIQETAANEWAAVVKNNDFKPEHLLNPKTNLLAGTWYLGKWSKRAPHTDDPRPFALAAYHAGPTKAREWAKDTNSSTEFIESIDYPATKQYVQTILEVQVEFHKRFDKYPKTNQ